MTLCLVAGSEDGEVEDASRKLTPLANLMSTSYSFLFSAGKEIHY
jgi:hypothetical protein